MVPPSHQPFRPRHPLQLRAQLIDGSTGYPFFHGRLLPPDVHPNGMEPRSLHCLHYQGVLPLSAYPSFSCHPHDPSLRLVVEPLQDLENMTGHHSDIAAVKDHQLRHRLIHCSLDRYCCYRTFQQPCYHSPLPPSFPQVLVDHLRITVIMGDRPP